MAELSESVTFMIEQLSTLPGIGRKSAERLAYHILRVPESEAFFADHFPRKPVFPGTLLMTLCINIARRLVSPEAIPIGIYHAKIREFMPPGSRLEFTAERTPENDKGDQLVMVSLKAGEQFKKLVKVGFGARQDP